MQKKFFFSKIFGTQSIKKKIVDHTPKLLNLVPAHYKYQKLLQYPHSFATVSVPRLQDHLITGLRVIDGIGPCLRLQAQAAMFHNRLAIFASVGAV